MSEYLSFENEEPYNRKTKHVGIYSKLHGEYLGCIKWFGRWRQYAFFPAPDTTWSVGCLEDINVAIGLLEQERKDAKRYTQKNYQCYREFIAQENKNNVMGVKLLPLPYDDWVAWNKAMDRIA